LNYTDLNSKWIYFIVAINTFFSEAVRGVTRLSRQSMIKNLRTAALCWCFIITF